MNIVDVLKYITPKHKKWVESLSSQQIACILNDAAPSDRPLVQKVSKTPAIIGQIGEDNFEDITQNGLSTLYNVQNTAKQAHAGDFVITWTSPKTLKKYSILVDVKNYDRSVPTKEVEKFFSDLRHTGSHSGGLLLSLKSPVTGFRKWTHVKNDDKTECIIMQSHTSEVICESIQVLFGLIELSDRPTGTIENMRIMEQIHSMEIAINAFSNGRASLQTMRTTILNQIDNVTRDLSESEYEIRNCLRNMSHVITGQTEEKKSEIIDMMYQQWGCDALTDIQNIDNICHKMSNYETNVAKKQIEFDCLNCTVTVKCFNHHINGWITNYNKLPTCAKPNQKNDKATFKFNADTYPELLAYITADYEPVSESESESE
jgi:hypothetical protein